MSQDMESRESPEIGPLPEPHESNAQGDAGRRQRRFRPRLGAGIALLGLIALTVVWFLSPDGYRAFLIFYVTGPAAALLLLLWWILLSGASGRTRLMGLAVVAGVAGLFLLTFRFEGFEGDMFPRFTFRWQATPEARAERFWNAQETDAFVVASKLEVADDDWPQFRGAGRNGIVKGVSLRRNWDARPPPLVWKHAVGPGWSSFAVVGELAFTQEQRHENETVVCYDALTGNQIWAHSNPVRFTEAMGGIGPRATPTVHDSRLYALGATGILDCLEASTGRLIWSANILEDADANNLRWAMAGSPLVYDDLVVVNPGGRNGKGVIAYDRLTGALRWAEGNRAAGYAAARLEVIDGVRQVLVFGGDGLAAHDPGDGQELWFREWTNQPKVNAAQPIVHDGRLVFFSCGYHVGSMLIEVEQTDGDWRVRDVWDRPNRNMKLKFNDAVYRDGYVYGLDEGILVCLEFLSGERRWKRGRYGYGQLLLVDDQTDRQCRLLIQAESGEVALVAATPEEFREIARFQAIEGKTWQAPAIADGKLFVRNAEEAACYDLE